jgi:hypothetical protein
MNPSKSILFWLSLDAFGIAGVLLLIAAVFRNPYGPQEAQVMKALVAIFGAAGVALVAASLIHAGVIRFRHRSE